MEHKMNSGIQHMMRALLAAALLLLVPILATQSAYADTQAEAFVSDNIQKGLGILHDPQLTAAQRSDQFEQLLLRITDMKRIALFTLGQYRQTATPAGQDAFVSAFENYSVAVYRSYLGNYAGQTLKITGSSQRSPTDFVVATQMVDPSDHSGGKGLEVDFRVLTDTGKPEVTDLGIGGIWLALAQRDQFNAFLAQHHGDIADLAAHLRDVANGYR